MRRPVAVLIPDRILASHKGKGVEIMVHKATIRKRARKIYGPVAVGMLVMLLCTVKAQNVPADSQTQLHRKPFSSDTLVIQGRITSIQGALATVKTPDGYPGGPGIHAQVVMGGAVFKVDVTRARVLLPDGRLTDTLPLAAGDRVLMVLSGLGAGSSGPNSPGNIGQTYFASIIERIIDSDRIVTH
jgi:hypothetical protein